MTRAFTVLLTAGLVTVGCTSAEPPSSALCFSYPRLPYQVPLDSGGSGPGAWQLVYSKVGANIRLLADCGYWQVAPLPAGSLNRGMWRAVSPGQLVIFGITAPATASVTPALDGGGSGYTRLVPELNNQGPQVKVWWSVDNTTSRASGFVSFRDSSGNSTQLALSLHSPFIPPQSRITPEPSPKSGVLRGVNWTHRYRWLIERSNWQGGTSGENLVLAKSGAMVASPMQGVLLFSHMDSTGYFGTWKYYVAPVADGPLTMVTFEGFTLYLRSDGGTDYEFNIEHPGFVKVTSFPKPSPSPSSVPSS